ncbi:hypothetical protein D3C86_1732580 [compost metagenome]
MLGQRNTQAEQQLAGAGFGGVAVHFGEFAFQLADLHAVFFAHLRQRIDAVALGFDRPELFMAHDHGIDHAELFVGELILAQFAQTHVRLQHHLTAARFQVVAENFHEGRLTAAVRPDQAVTVAAAKLDGNVLEQGFGPELHGDVSGGDQVPYLSIA